jgi:hypothetical protein
MADRGGPNTRNPYTSTGYTGTYQPPASVPGNPPPVDGIYVPGIANIPGAPNYQAPPITNAQQSMSSGYTPYVPPVGTTPQANSAPQISGPPAPNAPGTRPSAMGGSQAGINSAWAYDVATRYNPTTNSNLQYNYQQQLDQYQRNGNRTWDWQKGVWTNNAPVAPIYLSTDYDQNLQWTNQNTPGEAEYGQVNPDFMRPFTQQDASYAGTLTPWSTRNTGLNAGNTAMLPDLGKPATINFPNGIAPGSGQNAYNMMGVSPTQEVFANGDNYFPNAPKQPNPFANGISGLTQGGQPVPPGQPQGQGGVSSQGWSVPGAGPGSGISSSVSSMGQGNQAGLLSLLALLFGGGAGQQQSRQSPFFNNNRSQYYPNTGGPQTAPAPSSNDLALLKLLFEGQ